MKVRSVLVATIVALSAVTTAQATPITYSFSGTLTSTLNGSNTVAGTFTLDAATASLTDWSLTGPLGTFNQADSNYSIAQWTPAISPNANFVGLSFGDLTGNNHLWLRFETTLGAFDGSTFYTGSIIVPGGSTGSEYFCGPIPGGACSGPGNSPFSSGSATPVAAAVPEPASMLLLGAGIVGMGARRWRNRHLRG